MSADPSDLRAARRTVDRAEAAREALDAARTAGSARRAAVRRVAAHRHHGPVRRWVRDNGLTIAALTLFALSFAGQIGAGYRDANHQRAQHGEAAEDVWTYVRSPAFVEATAENWESEFLQMGIFVLLTARLYQRGASESKSPEEPSAVDQDPREGRDDPEAPWPVRRGGLALALYRHSLSIALLALFLAAFVAHVVGGAGEYNDDQRAHGGAVVSPLGYLFTSRLWFESLQNWQSEFLSVGVLVLLSIWLREEGSPQSKAVAAPHAESD